MGQLAVAVAIGSGTGYLVDYYYQKPNGLTLL